MVVLCDKGDWGSGEYCRERVERGVLEAREAIVLVLSISAKRCLTIELWLKFMMEGLCERKEDGVPRKEVLVDAPSGVRGTGGSYSVYLCGEGGVGSAGRGLAARELLGEMGEMGEIGESRDCEAVRESREGRGLNAETSVRHSKPMDRLGLLDLAEADAPPREVTLD